MLLVLIYQCQFINQKEKNGDYLYKSNKKGTFLRLVSCVKMDLTPVMIVILLSGKQSLHAIQSSVAAKLQVEPPFVLLQLCFVFPVDILSDTLLNPSQLQCELWTKLLKSDLLFISENVTMHSEENIISLIV